MSYCIVIDKRKIIGGFYLKITGKGKGKRRDLSRNLKIFHNKKNSCSTNIYKTHSTMLQKANSIFSMNSESLLFSICLETLVSKIKMQAVIFCKILQRNNR